VQGLKPYIPGAVFGTTEQAAEKSKPTARRLRGRLAETIKVFFDGTPKGVPFQNYSPASFLAASEGMP
jgi:hypothetical protein